MPSLLEKLRKIQIKHDSYKELPETPGVYVFFQNSTPIYIGKAINLKRRVSSYFDLNLEHKTKRMVSESNFISFIKVSSEFEALLLEARLIRKYMPHYNIAAKDDKHPLYITITKDVFPRVITTRKDGTFGPYPSSNTVRLVLRMLRRIFPYSDHKLGTRRCLYSHIGLCDPCPNEIIQSNNYRELRRKYLKNIKRIKSILLGEFLGVRNDLVKEMAEFSKIERYEDAKLIREQIERLDYITRPQLPTDYYMENPNLYEDQRKKELLDLANLLHINHLPFTPLKRIECYDVAHLAGSNPTASMVTFINGEAEKKFYRHFKIRLAKGGDDYASMREVAKRRAKHFIDWGKPNLIIVDGGAGQVKAFRQYITDVQIIGIAKHPDRLIINEEKIRLVDQALHLVSRMRDEAHRFARRYHHNLISKVYKDAIHS